MILNFGHTFGHAIEKQYAYQTYTHGEAVAIGMVMACAWGEKCHITAPGTRERMEKLLTQFGLPIRTELTAEALKDAVSVDKKGEGGKINLILLKEIGSVLVKKVDKDEFALS